MNLIIEQGRISKTVIALTMAGKPTAMPILKVLYSSPHFYTNISTSTPTAFETN
jgi:hypothetical protein